MPTQTKLRKALLSLSNVADFLRRHPEVSERTVYRQRADNPPRMRAAVAAAVRDALVQEGLIRGQQEGTANEQEGSTRSTRVAQAPRKVARRNTAKRR